LILRGGIGIEREEEAIMGLADRDYMRRRPETEPETDEPVGRPTGPFRILLVLIGLILLVAFLAALLGGY